MWRRRLFAWEEESVRECSLLLHNIVLQDSVNDTWRWLLDPIHGYSVREAYRYLTHSGDTVDRTLVDDVWHRHIPLKVSLLVWRLFRNRLPTKDNLLRRGVLGSTDITCAVPRCASTETVSHLFLQCDTFRELWSKVWNWLGISLVTLVHLHHHFIQFSTMAGLPRSSHLFFRTVWLATVWIIWKKIIVYFKIQPLLPLLFWKKINLNSFLWIKSKQASFCYSYTDWWKHPLLCMGVQV